ncbi:hypothetical protein PCANC_18211 [Puccinia coronata f. sp. avenae]|uniref:Beta-glucuronidase C-terminal domain-containing protein n=1 Tax=Puccinia coronata f. sp. avenae TaxID=200324 RepID=A0A2N5SJX3_9BASI|nr:hypothetical protein PCANC_18211 [Puccinia coronata f. sp. avenae]
MTEVKQTAQCLLNLEEAYGAPPAIRIGGITQAVYDPKQTQPIRYSLAPGETVPRKITFGPRFIELASDLKGTAKGVTDVTSAAPTDTLCLCSNVSVGPADIKSVWATDVTSVASGRRLNRQSGDQANTGLAALNAVQTMKNLYAIELGNEPEYWGRSSPEARGKRWTPEADQKSQTAWQQVISKKVNRPRLIQAGVFLSPPRWSVQQLAPQEGQNIAYVNSFGGHAYPQSACGRSVASLPKLMAHSEIVRFVRRFKPEVLAAMKVHRPYHFSETNSATCGGRGISATFGAGLWLVDYVFQSLILGVHRLYFHQGTINHSPYSFWNQTKISAPYYGAYFTALALRGASQIGVVDTTDPNVAVYSMWKCKQMIRLVVYNSKFQDDKASFSSPEDRVKIDHLPDGVSSARLLRLTAKHAFIRAGGPERGQIQIGGAYFDDNTCKISSPPKYETVAVEKGSLELGIHQSEMIIIELDRKDLHSC